MYEVSVDESFAAAHNLRGYKGKCEDLHGHNYKVRVTLRGAALQPDRTIGEAVDASLAGPFSGCLSLKKVLHGDAASDGDEHVKLAFVGAQHRA